MGTIPKLSLQAAIEQVLKCDFECEGGPLRLNVGWMSLVDISSDMLAALKDAERQLVAVYGEPAGTALESVAGAATIRAVRAAIAKAGGR